ncbi:MAG: GGDEF domain-containing protein [Lachnospiraceae bacterium]|nr:GGDEF domain-containing protein [Lachnospiraceae bacterium]
MSEMSTDSIVTNEYQEFIRQNRTWINKRLNRALWFVIFTGPAIALGVKGGMYKDISYSTCAIISGVLILIALIHFLILKLKKDSLVTSILALTALEGLIAFMAFSHVEIHLTWFFVPILSILLCETQIFIFVSIGNAIVMTITTWFVTAYEVQFRNNFVSHGEYFTNVIGGYLIETVIMFIAGLLIIKVATARFRQLISQNSVIKQKEKETEEKMTLLNSMAEIYDNVNLIDFVDNTEMSIRDPEHVKHGIDMTQQTHTIINQKLKERVMPDQLDSFLNFTNIKTVRSRLSHKKIISADFIDVVDGWIRAQYITVDATIDGIPNVVIYTTRNVDEEKKREERLIRVAMTDELTRLFNRRCYEEDLMQHRINPLDDDLVFYSIDVNGLKKVNDSKGHAAGDELIKGAADCLLLSIGNRGKVYRTGGDEFIAIVHTTDPKSIVEEIDRKSSEWSGVYTEEMSMSIGYASHAENENLNVDELERRSDAEMYAAKERYYKEKGIERRK